MNYGEILGTAWKVFWKYKVLWLVGILPYLLYCLGVLGSMLLVPGFPSMDPEYLAERFAQDLSFFIPVVPLLVMLVSLLVFLVLLAYALAANSLGVLKAEQGAGGLRFGELVGDTAPYFWRVLGLYALFFAAGAVIYLSVFGFMVVTVLASAGFASLCVFPLMLLLLPLFLIAYVLAEQAKAAIIVEDLDMMSGLRRGWEILKANFWGLVLMGLILYGGMYIVSLVAAIPLYAVMFVPLMTSFGGDSHQTFESSFRLVMTIMMVVMPFYMILQGLLAVYIRSTWTLTYLRLTRPIQPLAPAELPNA